VNQLLRGVLLLDAVLLFLLGALLILAPGVIEGAFQFANLPAGVNYIVGLWGCGLLTLSFGYAAAARDPLRHVAWVQVGIARGALETIVGGLYLAWGIVTIRQAGLGIAMAAFFALAYGALYPRAVPETAPGR
jgi:hypothetical protein